MNDSQCLDRPITESEALERLLRKGLWLAISRTGAALAGWQAENLVTCVDDFFVYPPQDARRLGPPLLESVERAAKELECEIAAVLVSKRAHPDVGIMLAECGYRLKPLNELDRIWREVLSPFLPPTESNVWVKQLRADRVVVPI
jgi:hypothetical protein